MSTIPIHWCIEEKKKSINIRIKTKVATNSGSWFIFNIHRAFFVNLSIPRSKRSTIHQLHSRIILMGNRNSRRPDVPCVLAHCNIHKFFLFFSTRVPSLLYFPLFCLVFNACLIFLLFFSLFILFFSLTFRYKILPPNLRFTILLRQCLCLFQSRTR